MDHVEKTFEFCELVDFDIPENGWVSWNALRGNEINISANILDRRLYASFMKNVESR